MKVDLEIRSNTLANKEKLHLQEKIDLNRRFEQYTDVARKCRIAEQTQMAQERTYKGQVFDAIDELKKLKTEIKLLKEKLRLLEDLKQK